MNRIQWHYDTIGDIWFEVEARLIDSFHIILTCFRSIVIDRFALPSKFRRLVKSLDVSKILGPSINLAHINEFSCLLLEIMELADSQGLSCIIPQLDRIKESMDDSDFGVFKAT